MSGRSSGPKVVTVYAEKYYRRRNTITREQAAALIADADAVWCDEQGQIEIPAYDKQQRDFIVLRIERIIQPVKSEAVQS